MRKERDARWIRQSARQKRRMSILCPETDEVKRYVWWSHRDRDLWYRESVCSPPGSVTEGLCVASCCTLGDTGESEGHTVAVEMWTAKWVEGRFHLPSRKGKNFSFPGDYLLFRLRAIKYNSSAFRRRRF